MLGLLAPLLCAPGQLTSEATVYPLLEVWDCRDSASNAACGPAVPQRTDGLEVGGLWQNRFEGSHLYTFRYFNNFASPQTTNTTLPSGTVGNNSLEGALRGATLDILLVPSEDDTFVGVDTAGRTYIGGLAGDLISLLAADGGFTWRAIIVNPPGAEYADWDAWAQDWVLRVGTPRAGSTPHPGAAHTASCPPTRGLPSCTDLVAVIFVSNPRRVELGLGFPNDFFDVSSTLVSSVTETRESKDFTERTSPASRSASTGEA